MELRHSHQAHNWLSGMLLHRIRLSHFISNFICLLNVKAFHLDISDFSKYKKATDFIFGDRISDRINYRARFSYFAFLEKWASHNKA